MLFDTSKARITVPSRCGQPSAHLRSGEGHQQQDERGQEEGERQVPEAAEAPGRAVGTKPCAASSAARWARRRTSARYADDQERRDARASTSICGQMNDISASAVRRSSTIRTRARTRSSCGRHLVEVDARPSGGCPQLGLTSLGDVVEAPAELGIAGVDGQQLAGLGVLHDDHARVGQLELARIDQPDGHQLVALARAATAGAPTPAR